jgi:hypothetical protein
MTTRLLQTTTTKRAKSLAAVWCMLSLGYDHVATPAEPSEFSRIQQNPEGP